MNSKDRMLIALNKGIPDRVPATIHQWQPYHLKEFMGGISDIEAFEKVGLDAAITCTPFIEEKSPYWEISSKKNGEITDYTVKTPEGNLTYQVGGNEYTNWITKHLIKNYDDIYLIKKYMPVPKLDKEYLSKYYDKLGNEGIMRTFINGYQGGCWQDACELFGTEPLIYAVYDEPDWVHELLSILLDKKLQYIYENLKGAKVDLVETGGGASSSTVISPTIHSEFCLPYDKKMHDALHDLGFKAVYHTCGGMMGILDLIKQNGCDASETLSPTGIGGNIADPSLVKRELGKDLALIGGLDQINILTSGTPSQVQEEVHKLFKAYGPNGGYIMSACDHFFHAPVENLKAYAKAAKECVY
jgi:uroporphyrinogen-III decarboxylase